MPRSPTSEARNIPVPTERVDWVARDLYCSDGKTRCVWERPGQFKLIDVESGRERALIDSPKKVLSASFSPDGSKVVVSGGTDFGQPGLATVHAVTTGEKLTSFREHTDFTECVTYSPRGEMIATGGLDKNICLWDARTHALLRVMRVEGEISSVRFSPDGETLASAQWDKTISIWDIDSGERKGVLEGHTAAVNVLDFAPDGRTLASGSHDFSVRIWDVFTGIQRATLRGHSKSIGSLVFSPDGTKLVSQSYDGDIKVWDLSASDSDGTTLEGHKHYVYNLAFSPDGTTLASGGFDPHVILWDVASGKQKQSLPAHDARVRFVTFATDGTLLTASESGTFHQWQLDRTDTPQTLLKHDGYVNEVALAPDGKKIAFSGNTDSGQRKVVKLFELETREITDLSADIVDTGVWGVMFSPDSSLLALGTSGGDVKIVKVDNQQVMHVLRGHQDSTRALVFSPSGHILATMSRDWTTRLWDVTSGQLIQHIDAGFSYGKVTFSPDGNTLVFPDEDTTIKFWDLTQRRLRMTFRGYAGAVCSLAFSPDGKTLASGSEDKTIRLWRAASEEEVQAAAQ